MKKQNRTRPCSREDAATRLDIAKKFFEVADLVASEEELPASSSVAAALAVLAGIAASDAACCAALGRRSRGQDHHDAEDLLSQVEPGGAKAASALRRLLDLKDTAHYGLIYVGRQKQISAMRKAEELISFASSTMRR